MNNLNFGAIINTFCSIKGWTAILQLIHRLKYTTFHLTVNKVVSIIM